MDQRDWGTLRDTVVRRTRASGASREDAEDAAQDALVAAIGAAQRPDSDIAWLSIVARRREIDRIRRGVRERRAAEGGRPDADRIAVGPEEFVVDREHASWLAASLTQLPVTTREVVDAVGTGMAPAEVARSMNLSARSVESHLTRARRHLRRLGALGVPVAALLGWALRRPSGSRIAPAAMAVAVPVLVVGVAMLPSSVPLQDRPAVSLPVSAPVAEPVEPAPSGPSPGPGAVSVAPGGGAPAADPVADAGAGRVPAGEPAPVTESGQEPVADAPTPADEPVDESGPVDSGQPGSPQPPAPGPGEPPPPGDRAGDAIDAEPRSGACRSTGGLVPQLVCTVGEVVGSVVDVVADRVSPARIEAR